MNNEIQGAPFQLRVISQQPPGGRCTLYARYAQEISSSLGMEMDKRGRVALRAVGGRDFDNPAVAAQMQALVDEAD